MGEDGGFDSVAFFDVAGTAEVDGGAFELAGVDVGYDALWRKANETDKESIAQQRDRMEMVEGIRSEIRTSHSC